VNECKPLMGGPVPSVVAYRGGLVHCPGGRALHSFTLELNLSNSRSHSGLSWVIQGTDDLKLS
jgi:hypothetical protein